MRKQLFTVAAILAFGFGTTPFGGRILATIPCTCNTDPFDTLLIVGPPRPGSFLKTFSTRVYQYGNFSIGTWVLGLASGEGTCKVGAGFLHACVPAGFGQKIKMVGTS